MFYKVFLVLVSFSWPSLSLASSSMLGAIEDSPASSPVVDSINTMTVEELYRRGIQLYNKDDKAHAHGYFKNVIKKLNLENEQATLDSEKKGILSQAIRHYEDTSIRLGKNNYQALIADKNNRQIDIYLPQAFRKDPEYKKKLVNFCFSTRL